ncbi:uncharacterized protein [Argopecten irradians]|uniref:uncharacterized protein n=1 Tax=Argopecten irradians TaxID=31199 RepID=UPI003721A628
MAQKTIKDLKKTNSGRAGPYPDCTVRVKVAKVGHSANFTASNGEEMVILNFSVADTTDSIMATLNDQKRHKLVAEGKCLLLRNFVVKNNKIILTKLSKLMTCSPIEVPEDIIQQAVFLIQPPSTRKKIAKVKTMPIKSYCHSHWQNCEVESSDECTRTVKVGGPSGQDADIHTIRIESDGDEINLSLWREMAKVPLKVGQYIEATQCLTGDWQGQKKLNSTRNTKVTQVDIPETTYTGMVEGISVDEDKVEIALQVGETYQDLTIRKDVLIASVHLDSEESLEDHLTEMLPFLITVTTKGGDIISVSQDGTRDRPE